MLNHYPLWKNLVILLTIIIASIFALPNIFGEDPALQIATSKRGIEIDVNTLARIEKSLAKENIKINKSTLRQNTGKSNDLLIRFNNESDQLRAKTIIQKQLGDKYAVAINLAPATPEWLLSLGAKPMYLGLDLRGGVYFLMQVDMESALSKTLKAYLSDSRQLMRKAKIRYTGAKLVDEEILLRFKNDEDRENAATRIKRDLKDLLLIEKNIDNQIVLSATINPQKLKEIQTFALKQNITTLRKRIDEKFNGLVEPIIQQQGTDRIIIQLPGIQDTAGAKDILGATATLEYRAVDEEHDVDAALNGKIPVGSKIYYTREEKLNGRLIPSRPVLLKKRMIVSGEHVTNANASIDPETNGALVSVTLDSYGGKKMDDFTKSNVGKGMAVVYLETKRITQTDKDGKKSFITKTTEEVISVATIRGRFSTRFQTTGLDSVQEANNLALLLRSGALAAPVYIIEERTIGPSLGQDNIDKGFLSVIIGFVAVLVFMLMWYLKMGAMANIALALNLVIIVAVLSMLQATLTLPGIAGIVLTIGMAVDANVLIFERIREELRNGNTPQNSIHSGFEKAFMTIADANITTLIAAFVLFVVGTGAIKGFAITLSIGIMTSMFTAIFVCRGIVNFIYGGKKVDSLSI
ncbi:MAG: protein translocase subunit SecD [Gammaproteobacteria bacterium]|nr:protein translocase subunit SecD [Gammaproteobacteria bacterium]